MKIDCHQHFWNPARGDYSWMAGPSLEHLRRAILPRDCEPHQKTFA